MANWDDVQRICLALPDTEEREGRTREWRVRNKLYAWERPLRQADLDHLGEDAPDGEILGARVPGEVAKQALLQDNPDVYFTTPHFNGYPAILVHLDRVPLDELEELLVEAWAVQAPKRLVRDHLGPD